MLQIHWEHFKKIQKTSEFCIWQPISLSAGRCGRWFGVKLDSMRLFGTQRFREDGNDNAPDSDADTYENGDGCWPGIRMRMRLGIWMRKRMRMWVKMEMEMEMAMGREMGMTMMITRWRWRLCRCHFYSHSNCHFPCFYTKKNLRGLYLNFTLIKM